MATATVKDGRSARRRLLDAADELFYAEGVQTVGIDRIIERAGVAKASLYNCFSGKEELVAAYLGERSERIKARVTAATANAEEPRAKILAIFDSQAEVMSTRGYRGCAFLAAATEAKDGGLVDETAERHRAWLREVFTGLARDAGASQPSLLAEQLQMIYDGVSVSVRMEHDASVARAARAAVAALVDAGC